MKPGIDFGISNEDYHAGDGVSKSQFLTWLPRIRRFLNGFRQHQKTKQKKSALDMGTALHCLLLEPRRIRQTLHRFTEIRSSDKTR